MLSVAKQPTVTQFHAQSLAERNNHLLPKLDADWLRQICLDAGADDVGFVEIDRPEIADQRGEILELYP